MKTSDFDYELPPERIAQHPAPTRDESRLLLLRRESGETEHHRFHELPALLRAGDLLVVNDTRVLPARLFATVARSGGAGREGAAHGGTPAPGDREVEVLILREEPAVPPERIWSALARPARALTPGAALRFVDPSYTATVRATGERGVRHIAFTAARPGALPFEAWLSRVGHVPLPPYIRRPDEPEDRERYQTVFAREPGSAAAPTAGLHFTERTLTALREHDVRLAPLTLHVGPGTFRPVSTEDPSRHVLEPEPYRLPAETAAAILAAREAGARVLACGTTCVRALESWTQAGEPQDGSWRETGLLVLPGHAFRAVQGMVTNFHLPRSSLLMLVSALAGRENVLRAYAEAVREGYRFYSYGDAMLVI